MIPLDSFSHTTLRFTREDLIDAIRVACENARFSDDDDDYYEEEDYSRDGFREDYSGRAMYGRTCPGVVTDDFDGPTFGVHFALEVQRRGFDAARALSALGGSRQDSMGRSTIIYWPAVGRLNPEAVIDTREEPEPEPEAPAFTVCDDCAPEWPCPKCQDAMTGSTFAANGTPDYDALFASVEA